MGENCVVCLKWADSQVEGANLAFNKIDKNKSAELSGESQIYAYEARVRFSRLDFLLRSKSISHIDLQSVSWANGIDSNAIKSIETHNRRLNFTTTQKLALDSGANLGTMSFKMDFTALPTAIAWYYLWIAFAVIFVCVAMWFYNSATLSKIGANASRGGGLPLQPLIFFTSLYLLFFILNFLFPTQSDDLGAGFGGLSAAYQSYIGWNGRLGDLARVAFGSYLAHTALYPFINALVCVAFVYLFFVLMFARLPFMCDSKGESKMRDITTIAFILLCLFAFKGFGSVFYWAAGSFNYLWAWVLIMAWCVPFRLFWGEVLAKDSPKDSRIFGESKRESIIDSNANLHESIAKSGVLAMLFLGIFAGWASEFGIVLIIAQFAFIAFALYKRVKIPAWYFAGVVGFIVGWLILYLSPGHSARGNIVNELNNDSTYITIGELIAMPLVDSFKRFAGTFSKDPMGFLLVATALIVAFVRFRFGVRKVAIVALSIALIAIYAVPITKFAFVILVGAVCFWAGFKCKNGANLANQSANPSESNLLFALCGLFVAYFLATAATIQIGVPSRARVPYILLGMAQIIVAYLLIKPYLANRARFVGIAIRIMCAIFTLFIVSECATMRLKWERMIASIEAQKAMGAKEVIVSADTFRSNYRGYGDWGNPNENTNEWPNTTYAKVFGAEKFIVGDLRK